MINEQLGHLVLDKPEVLIHPELTLAVFESLNLDLRKGPSAEKQNWRSYVFNGALNGLTGDFEIYFRAGELYRIQCFPSASWKAGQPCDPTTEEIRDGLDRQILPEDRRLRHQLDDWLKRVVKSAPPYEYNWGSIDTLPSLADGPPFLRILYRRDYEDRGIFDLKAHYEERRRYIAGGAK